MLLGLGIGLALSGCAHDRRIRVTRWPRSEPLPGLFNIGGSTRGRSETPQPICHPRDLMVVHVDFAMFSRR
jgi:hypothetical protein